MNRFLFSGFLLIGLNFYSYGQVKIDTDEYSAKRSDKIEKPNAIFFAPLNFFDFQNPSFQMGYERWGVKRFQYRRN